MRKSEDEEATLFAMELLMPEKLLVKDIEGEFVDILQIRELAKRYEVEVEIMMARLIHLKYKILY